MSTVATAGLRPLGERLLEAVGALARVEPNLSPEHRARIDRELALFAGVVDDVAARAGRLERALVANLAAHRARRLLRKPALPMRWRGAS